MIVNALYRYYATLLQDPDSGVSHPGFSRAKVGHCLVITKDGSLANVLDLRVTRGNKLVTRDVIVPEQLKRTSGVSANFLCDNCSYVLGLGQKNKDTNQKRIQGCRADFLRLHREVLEGEGDEGAAALLSFLNNWDPEKAEDNFVVARHLEDLSEGLNLVFMLEGTEGFLHDRKAITEAWNRYNESQTSDVRGQCLITGKDASLARLHPSIKGVTGAQSSGASLVSFNQNSFTSYGKTQSFNAPICTEAAFGYTTALNYLLNSLKHRIRIGDTTVVFWAERSTGGMEEDLLGALFFPPAEGDGEAAEADSGRPARDPQTNALVRDILNRIREGRAIEGWISGINSETSFYILGLAPNASRLAVRFWHMDPYIRFIDRIGRHYQDLAVEKNFESEPDYIPISRILKETAPRRDAKRIAPLLGGAMMRAVLTGSPYPMSLYQALISRIRADQEVNYVRASIIKACLVRNRRIYKNQGDEVELTMALNEENLSAGYLLGRLFALLEKAQSDANPGINATIRDRYFGTASASPSTVFPILLRLAQHHISKAEYGRLTDKRIEEVVSLINSFPAHLSLEEQGQFVLGYYQQRRALFTKSEKKETDE